MTGNTHVQYNNPLNDKLCLLYTRTQSVPRSNLSPPRYKKKNLLMLYKIKVALCSEI